MSLLILNMVLMEKESAKRLQASYSLADHRAEIRTKTRTKIQQTLKDKTVSV